MFRLPEPSEDKFIDRGIAGLAVDNSNNVYVIKRLQIRTGNGDAKRCVLNVLDDNYNITHYCTLDFLGELSV